MRGAESYGCALALWQAHTGQWARAANERGRRQVCAAMQELGLQDAQEYAARLSADPRVLSDLVDRLAVPESYFFRNQELFDRLEHETLPALAQLLPEEHVLRVWSAGCARGEEPYSLAILLEQSQWAERYRLLATDLSEACLRSARLASYRAWSLRGVDRRDWARWFRATGDRLQLHPRYQQRVRFERHNLSRDPFPPGQDLILCRNVLIYFDPEAVAQLAARMYESLAPWGVLCTGPADPPLGPHAAFATISQNSYGTLYSKAEASKPRDERPHPAAKAQRPRKARSARHAQLPHVKETPDVARPGLGEAPDWSGVSLDASLAVEEALARDPGSAPLHYVSAMLRLQQGEHGEAQRLLRAALVLDPDLIMGHVLQGVLLGDLGDARRARGSLRAAARLCARLPETTLVPLSAGQRVAGLLAAIQEQLRGPEP